MQLSSGQVAILLDTHESSVKRWCNAGELECLTTNGGHRRIELAEVTRFAQKNHLSVDVCQLGTEAALAVEGVLRLSRRHVSDELLSVIRHWLLDADSRKMNATVRIARAFGASLPVIYDRLIGRLMKQVGESWARGAFSIGEEHRISESIFDVLYGIQTTLEAERRPLGPAVVLGTIQGEQHVTGAMMIRTLLTEAGYRVSYLGRNVPVEDFLLFQRKQAAPFICLSATLSRSPEEIVEAVNKILILGGEAQFHVAVGGSGVAVARTHAHRVRYPSRVRFFDTATDFMEWVDGILFHQPVLEHETR